MCAGAGEAGPQAERHHRTGCQGRGAGPCGRRTGGEREDRHLRLLLVLPGVSPASVYLSQGVIIILSFLSNAENALRKLVERQEEKIKEMEKKTVIVKEEIEKEKVNM